MNEFPSVSIIILNYNRAKDTIDCINSIYNIDYPNYKIILIDNCSTDNSVEVLTKQLQDVKILNTENNIGYTGGVNFGLKKVQQNQTDYILLLNNDTVVENIFLSELVSALENDKQAAAACGTILCEHNRNEIWYAGGEMVNWRGLAIHKGKKSIFKRDNLKSAIYTTFVTGCMILLRTKYLQQIGHEDERFFMYLDDIELSARIQRKGFKLLYVPTSIIYHKVLNEDDSPFKLYYSARNRLLLISSMLSGIMKLVAFVYFICVITIKMIFWKFFNPRFYQAAKHGLVDYFRGNFFKGRGFEFL